MARPKDHRPLSVTLNPEEHAAVLEAARIRAMKASDILRAGLIALEIPVRPGAEHSRAAGSLAMTEYGFMPARVRRITSIRAAEADADTDEHYATLPAVVLPMEVTRSIKLFARERSMTTGAVVREGLRRVGALRLDDVALGFAEPQPRRTAA